MRATSTHRLLVVALLALCLTPAFAVPILPAQQKTQDAEPADEENDSAELQVAPAPTDNQQTNNNDDNDGADDDSEEAVQPAMPRFASAPAPTPAPPSVPPAVAINSTTSANATAPPPADKFNPSISADCWKFSQRTTQHVGPSDPRENHFSFYIEDQQRLMVWGGCGTGSHGATCASSLQQLDVAKGIWEEAPVILNSNAQLVKAVGAAYAYNPVSHRVYEFGGTRQKPEGASITNIMSVLYLDPQSARWNWQIPQVEGDVPMPRADATFTTFGTSLVLFGGYNDNTFFNSLYYINSSSTGAFKWTRPKVKGVPPAARAGHSAVRVGNKIFFFGGSNGKITFNDLHVLTVPANRFDDPWEWNVVVPQSPQFAPSARSYHTSTLLPNSRIAFFGGVNQQAAAMSYFNDLYVLDVSTMTWVRTPESLAKALVPTARKKHSGVLLGSKLLFTGGCAHQHCYDIFTPLVLDTAAVCPNSCKNGKYNVSDPVGSCVCNTNYDGKFCETLMTCPKNCTGNGYCKDGVCRCKLGFGGPDCSTPVCPNNCNGQRGQCSQSEKRCVCNVGYWGLDCSQDACPNNCFGRGICQKVDRSIDKRGRNKCKCDPGFSGDDCGQFAVNSTSLKNQLNPPNSTYDPGYTCPNHCSGHGRCTRVLGLGGSVGGRCQCLPGFAGRDCSGECTLHCGGALRGTCTGADPLSVQCKCNEGFKGIGCIDQYCARNCSGHGVCFNNKCFCDAPFSGAACELDTSCSKNGLFVNNKCQCKAGFGGKDCSQRVFCKGGCSGNGECHGTTPEDDQKTVSGYCVCSPGWKGDQCDEKQCPLGCSGNGKCRSNGKCSCYSGFAGTGCERIISCPNNCTGSHGLCQVNPDAPLSNKGVCVCKPQWAGDDCSDIGCRSNCYGRGKCIEGKCLCDDGYSGKECEVACPKRCSNKGLCVNGVCACFPGYSSDDCNKTATCPGYDTPTGECGRRGECYRPRGECFCNPGYTGPDCSKESKCGAQGCGQHGQCKHGKCFCDPGYEGDHCERKSSCDQDCMGRGICMHGKCFCNTGFEGGICEKYAYDPRCPGNCTGNGVCQYGRCFCTEGYTGANCSTPTAAGKCLLTPNSKIPCEGKGLCRFAKCFCYPGSSGDFCEKKEICPGGCVDGQGTCLMGQCRCLPGFKGPDCSEDMVCEGTPLPCSGHGVCIQGKCACLPGYGGSACEQSPLSSTKCPNNCTNGGVCHMGRCFCIEGRDGPDCSIKTQDACHLGCSKRGLCRFGQCFCKPGYVGRGCETEVKCSAKCLTNGVCAYGHCFCVPGWEGRDCDVPVNFNETLRQIEQDIKDAYFVSLANGRKGNKTDPRYCEGGCSGRGICLNNKCSCDVGFYGANCDKVRGGPQSHRCPNNCNNQGKCLFGKCYCDIGFVGGECEIAAPVKCPKNCNGKGVCHLGVCKCEPGYIGADCGKKTECHKLCAIHQRGVCHEGKCVCVPGFTGTHCETRVENFGRFREVAASFDKPVSTPEQGPSHASPAASLAASINDLPVEVKDATAAVLGVESNCLQNCGSNGVCVRDTCFCAPGFTGSDCASKIDEHPVAPVSITPVNLASSASLPLASERSNVSYIVLAFIAFGAGIIACLGAQLAWAWYQKRQRKLATQAILTPLLHTLDQ